jgi:uncharacterized membrane protein
VSRAQRGSEFPRFVVTVAMALLILSLVLLVFLAGYLVRSIQLDNLIPTNGWPDSGYLREAGSPRC